MANNYKCVFNFVGPDGSSWSEVMYRTAADLETASTFSKALLDTRLELLHKLCKMTKIRVSDVINNRLTKLVGVGRNGTPSGGNIASGPILPAPAAIVLTMAATGGGSRKLWLRGCGNVAYLRNADSGVPQPGGTFLDDLRLWFANLKTNSFGIRVLSKPGVGQGRYFDIKSTAPAQNIGYTDLTLNAAPGYPVPSRVIISRASKKDLPALNGRWDISAVNGSVITVRYTSNGPVQNAAPARMRLEVYEDVHVFDPLQCSFDHPGARATSSPLYHSRGHRSASRGLRNSV